MENGRASLLNSPVQPFASEEAATDQQSGANQGGSTETEESVSTRVHECLERVKKAAFEEIGCLRLPDATSRDVMVCVQRVFENEMRKHNPTPETEEPGPVYSLRFNHDCQAYGCTQSTCDLCESNPRRGCTTDFDKKYFKGDVIKAKCGGAIFLELIDTETRQLVPRSHHVPNAMIELSIIDGNKFEQLFPHSTPMAENMHCLESCILIHGNEGRPLLQSEDKAHNREHGKVFVAIQSPKTNVCDLSVHCSSEALLSGRRPPFRLMARYVSQVQSCSMSVIPAISSNFIVASGRSRLSQKKSIPFADDPVSRLEHMGKERIKKLCNLVATAEEMNVEFQHNYPFQITTVADFKKLAFAADTDGQLKQKLLHMLKMSEKAWEETRDHAACAITNDTRMRAWYRPGITDIQGLAYVCYMGETDIHRPVALLIDATVVLKEHLDVEQRNLMQELQAMAVESWWIANHPGWTFFLFDSEDYKKDHTSLPSLGQLGSDHQRRKWSIHKKTERDPANGNDGETTPPNSKRLKKNKSMKLTIPDSPPSPEPIRSPYETEYLRENQGAVPSSRGRPADMFAHKEAVQTMLPAYSGPVIPRSPPDSAFTRRIRGHCNKAAVPKAVASHKQHQQIPDPAIVEQFYVTASASQNKGASNVGTNDVYAPLKTPFDSRTLEELLRKQMTHWQQLKSDGSADIECANSESEQHTSQDSVLPMDRALVHKTMMQEHGDQFPKARSPNHLSCSIESLPSQCKAAILEDQRIRQMEKSAGYSNQDFQHSFEGCVLGQMKRRATQSSPPHNEAIQMIPIEVPGSQVQVQATDQRPSQLQSGLFSYGIVLVPVANGQARDPNKPANS